MDSKERVLTAVQKRAPDRLPVFCGRIDDLDHWLACFRVKTESELRALWGLDCQKTKYGDIFYTKPGKTVWGSDDNWDAGYNSAKDYPLANAGAAEDIEKHGWPTEDNVNFDEISKKIRALNPRCARITSIGFSAVFCTLCDLFGMEQAMANLYINPGLIEASIEKFLGFMLPVMKRVLDRDAQNLDFFWMGDDFSTQRGIMIAPEQWRRFFKPVYLKMFGLIKSYGLMVWFHSCGSFAPVIGELVDGGMDVWETVQAHLDGNEPGDLKKKYGKNLSFFGAINSQRTLPFGTPEDVRREVRERFRVLGKGGGYIVGPDHSLQKNMPPQNVEALFDEAHKCLY
jgi:uroporphyrinogen decarboxylase